MSEIFIPALGSALEQCVIVEWLRQPGELVTQGDLVALIETDKGVVDLESPGSGVMGPHRFPAGATVEVGATICEVQEGGADQERANPPPQGGASDGEAATAGSDLGSGTVPPERAVVASPRRTVDSSAAEGPRQRHQMSPRQRAAAAAAAGAASSAPVAVPAASEGDRHREAIARQVAESWQTIPHFTASREIVARNLLAAREAQRHAHPDVSISDLLVRALALSVASEGPVNLGMAVATERGVAVPILTDVLDHDPSALAAVRKAAVARVREGRLLASDGASAAATLSNLGGYGVDHFTGVIPLGQPLLLTIGSIRQRPVVVDGELRAAPTLMATLNLDHRVYDGIHAAAMLERLDAELQRMESWS